jgi:hypothetical protein
LESIKRAKKFALVRRFIFYPISLVLLEKKLTPLHTHHHYLIMAPPSSSSSTHLVKEKKGMDEDRIRRRELLEQKRLIRKQQQQQAQQLEQEEEEEQQRKQQEENNKKTKSNGSTENTTRCMILTLPDDAMYHIYSMLCAIDLGRMILTCRHMNYHILSSSRIHYLLSRLSSRYNHPSHSSHHPHDSINIDLSPPSSVRSLLKRNWYHTPSEIQELLNQSLLTGNERRCKILSSFAKYHNEFISYARFIEEVICGYCALSSSKNSKNDDDDDEDEIITLPYHIQGRFVSCSPEHTIYRIGGDGITTGSGGSGIARYVSIYVCMYLQLFSYSR